jgi:hypothetical protein
MQTVFPDDTGYAGLLLVGFRKDPAHLTQTQRIGTAILKRTYDIAPAFNPLLGSLTSASEALPVFDQDQPDVPEPRIRFEHDLAPFKPEGDVAVLEFIGVTGLTQFQVNEQTWLERTVLGTDFDMFGWASRSEDAPNSRKNDAGTVSEDPNAYPPEWPVVNPLKNPLPIDFNNRFYNGYHRQARIDGAFSALPHIPAAAHVRIQRPGPSNDYAFTLGSEVVAARFYYYRGYGPDEERYWLSQNVPVVADTLVIEPEIDRCYVVWRAVWNFDTHPDDVYRKLVVSVVET